MRGITSSLLFIMGLMISLIALILNKKSYSIPVPSTWISRGTYVFEKHIAKKQKTTAFHQLSLFPAPTLTNCLAQLTHTVKIMAKFSVALTSILLASASAFAPSGIQQAVR